MSTRALLACGVVGPLLFIGVSLIECATRPGYSAYRHFVSQLATGALAFAVGLWRLGIRPVGVIGYGWIA